jgi:hypothetical protein
MMEQDIYCPKCQCRTPTDEWTHCTSKTNRPMVKGFCSVCHTRKSSFVKKDK